MHAPTPIARITVPLGGQQIEMHPVQLAEGGLAFLRVRIREGRRFTVFDIDPGTARAWGEALSAWGREPGEPA